MDESIVDTVTEALTTTDLKMVTWERVKNATLRDTMMSTLVETIEEGFPDELDDVPPEILDFYQFRNDLHEVVKLPIGRLHDCMHAWNVFSYVSTIIWNACLGSR